MHFFSSLLRVLRAFAALRPGGIAMELIGQIVRLQVQESSLKMGERPRRWYEPGPIRAVPMLMLDTSGVTGREADGTIVPDVHNAAHPASKHRGENGVSVGF